MKKLSLMALTVLPIVGFALVTVLPSALAVGFLVEAAGITVVTKFISALLALAFVFLGLNPIIA